MKGSLRPSAMSFSEWLKGARRARGMTQKELACACGVTDSYICRIERELDSKKHGETSRPSQAIVEAIARALGVPCEVARTAAGYSPSPRPYRFGAWLRLARLKSGLSQEELAQLCGITGGYVSLLEQEEGEAGGKALSHRPSVAVVDAIARALGFSYEDARVAAEFSPPRPFSLPTHERELIEKFRTLPVYLQLDVEAAIDALYQRHLRDKGSKKLVNLKASTDTTDDMPSNGGEAEGRRA